MPTRRDLYRRGWPIWWAARARDYIACSRAGIQRYRLGLAGSHFVEFNGKPVKSVKTGFKKAVALAQLNGGGTKVIPHTLRHTAATWLMQRGVSAWEAAGYLGMSTEMIERVYGHHSPEHLRKAAEAITGKTESVSVAVSVVGEKNARPKHR